MLNKIMPRGNNDQDKRVAVSDMLTVFFWILVTLVPYFSDGSLYGDVGIVKPSLFRYNTGQYIILFVKADKYPAKVNRWYGG